MELAREQQSPDGHRRGLRDKRAEQRGDDEDGEPRRADAAPTDSGNRAEAGLGDAQDWPRSGHRHDDNDKHRLRELHFVADVIENRPPVVAVSDRADQHDDPDAEHRFNLPEKVQDLALEADFVRQASSSLSVRLTGR